MLKRLIAALFLSALISHACAQGIIAPGHVIGNGSAANRTATDYPLSSVMDKALCGNDGSVAIRAGGLWSCANLGTGVVTALGNAANATGGFITWPLNLAGAGVGSSILLPANGGSGVASPTAHGVLIAEGASPFNSVTAGLGGLCLLSSASGDPTWGSCGGAMAVASVNGLAGTITIADNGGSTVANTTSPNTITLGTPGGYLNKFRNGTLDVWQRGVGNIAASTSSPGPYTADGWQVQQAGAAFTCTRATGTSGTLYALQCVGGTSNTDTVISQPIESYVAAPLAGKVVTWQVRYKQDTGAAVTPKVSSCYASAQDNFSTCTSDLASTSLTSCASGSWCVETYTFTTNALASQGYRISFDCNTALSASQHCSITAADVRATPGVSTGIGANPPPPELRPVQVELAFCERYYEVDYFFLDGSSYFALLNSAATANQWAVYTFAVQKRVAPTFSIITGAWSATPAFGPFTTVKNMTWNGNLSSGSWITNGSTNPNGAPAVAWGSEL